MKFKRQLTALAFAMAAGSSFTQLVVGVSYDAFQEERWKTDEAAIKAELAKSGAKYIMSDAGTSAEKQLSDIDGRTIRVGLTLIRPAACAAAAFFAATSACARSALCTSSSGMSASATRLGWNASCTNSRETSRCATTFTKPMCGIFTTRRAIAYVIALVR